MLFVTSGRFDVLNADSGKQQNNIHDSTVTSVEKRKVRISYDWQCYLIALDINNTLCNFSRLIGISESNRKLEYSPTHKSSPAMSHFEP
jgi:hypothetical protein